MKNKIKKLITGDQILTFTKRWVNIILWFSILWITMSYILAFAGRTQIAQSLSNNIVKVIIGVFVTYAIKAFMETKEQKKNELKEKGIK